MSTNSACERSACDGLAMDADAGQDGVERLGADAALERRRRALAQERLKRQLSATASGLFLRPARLRDVIATGAIASQTDHERAMRSDRFSSTERADPNRGAASIGAAIAMQRSASMPAIQQPTEHHRHSVPQIVVS